MACACKNKGGSSSSSNVVYTVTVPGGGTRTFSNKTDADLYASRSGGKVTTSKK